MGVRCTVKKFFPIIILFLLTTLVVQGQSFDKLAQTPPMGWNSWNKFGCDVTETLIKQMADAMVSSGMRDAGYQYIVIDDCWQVSRDSSGNIVADPKRFPSGMKALGDYIHKKGLKFGIYSCAGSKTCQGRPGSRGYQFQDARQYAAWGVDYLKYDWCNTGTQDVESSYTTMRDALEKSGRPIVFSICEWGASQPWTWAPEVGNLWRTTFDIRPCWDCGKMVMSNGRLIENFMGFTKILDLQVGLESFSGPGHWNDPDMLEVGNGELTYDENVAHFSLWCILAAPLMLGNDIRNMSDEVQEIITNGEVIAVNQDPLGRQGKKVRDEGDFEIWSRELHDGSRAVVMFNRSEKKEEMSFKWSEIGLPQNLEFTVRDLWKKQNLGKFTGSYSDRVPPHGVVMVRLYHQD